MLKSAGGATWWESAKQIFNANPEFVSYMDNLIDESAPITETWPWCSTEDE